MGTRAVSESGSETGSQTVNPQGTRPPGRAGEAA